MPSGPSAMTVELTAAHDAEFARCGFVQCAGVLPPPLLARASATIDRLYSSEVRRPPTPPAARR